MWIFFVIFVSRIIFLYAICSIFCLEWPSSIGINIGVNIGVCSKLHIILYIQSFFFKFIKACCNQNLRLINAMLTCLFQCWQLTFNAIKLNINIIKSLFSMYRTRLFLKRRENNMIDRYAQIHSHTCNIYSPTKINLMNIIFN